MKSIKKVRKAPPPALHPDALYSWNEIAPFVRVSRETWRQRVNDLKAPQKVPMGIRAAKWRGGDVLAWIANPNAYKATR